MLCKVLLLLTVITAIAATPVNVTNVGDSCTITSYNQVNDVVKKCTKITVKNLSVPAGKALEMNLKSGTSLTFEGTTSFGYGTAWEGPMVLITGNKISVTGASGSKLDGQGAHYWDGQGDKGKKKPKFFRIKATGGSTFSNINLLNCPHQCVSILNSKDLTISNWNIDVSAGDKNNLGHNTDGFDISSTSGLTVKNCIVQNQDDCVAVNSGSNLHFSKLTCSGGHGISLSVGVSKSDSSKNQASNITFSDCTVKNSRNGIHIKTHSDATTGYIKDVKYSNIKMSGITYYGINIQQDYQGGHSTGKPTNNIPIQNFELSSISGSLTGSKSMGVYIMCGSKGCSNFKGSGISLSGAAKKNSCTNYKPAGYGC